MKTLFSVLVLLLVFLLVPGENAISNDKPYVPPPGGVSDGGDDHPWGGDDPDGDGVSGRGGVPCTVFGIPVFDLIYNTLKYRELADAHPRKTRHSRIIRFERAHSIYSGPTQDRNDSQDRSGRVRK